MGATITRNEPVFSPAPAPASAAARIDDRITRTEWCLRIGASGCFIGHGAFGILTKAAWIPYFGVVGLGPDAAYVLMPVVGVVDILAGIMVLLSPRPIVLLYMVVWGVWTALLRPITGESPFETLERAGNYGVPLALLLMLGSPRRLGELLRPYGRAASHVDRVTIGRVLLGTTSTLLFAHGALAAITRKPGFAAHYAAIGLPGTVAPVIGAIEMAVAVLILVAPLPALLVAVAAWKMMSEALFPIAGAPAWEFVERAGSYAAPVALVLLLGRRPFTRINLTRSSTS